MVNNQYTTEDSIKEHRHAFFFYKLYNAKFPKTFDKRSKDYYEWALKHYTGLAYYNYIALKNIVFFHVTKYFPFSLLPKNTLGHYASRGTRRLIYDIVNEANKVGYSISYVDDNTPDLFYEFNYYFTRNVGDYEIAIHSIEKELQKKYSDIYVRRLEANKITIIISSDKYFELIKKFEKKHK